MLGMSEVRRIISNYLPSTRRKIAQYKTLITKANTIIKSQRNIFVKKITNIVYGKKYVTKNNLWGSFR